VPRAECAAPDVGVGPKHLVGVQCVNAGGDEMPGHATRRQVIAGVRVPCGVRAGVDAGRTRAAEGNGRRTIVCTRNRTAHPFRVARKMATLRNRSSMKQMSYT